MNENSRSEFRDISCDLVDRIGRNQNDPRNYTKLHEQEIQ